MITSTPDDNRAYFFFRAVTGAFATFFFRRVATRFFGFGFFGVTRPNRSGRVVVGRATVDDGFEATVVGGIVDAGTVDAGTVVGVVVEDTTMGSAPVTTASGVAVAIGV